MGPFDDLSFGWRTAVLAVPFVELLPIVDPTVSVPRIARDIAAGQHACMDQAAAWIMPS